jgi:hypothetical protein
MSQLPVKRGVEDEDLDEVPAKISRTDNDSSSSSSSRYDSFFHIVPYKGSSLNLRAWMSRSLTTVYNPRP